MTTKIIKSPVSAIIPLGLNLLSNNCFNMNIKSDDKDSKATIYPSYVFPFIDEFKIIYAFSVK